MELKPEHIAILDHTFNRASVRHCFCGDSPEMQELVAAGLMQALGYVAWCPDPYFRITNEGCDALKRQSSGKN